MGNAYSSGAQDGAMVLARFREANGAYESATDAERSGLFARRHAALMLVLGTHPSSHDEVCDIMHIALGELTNDLLQDGPVPRAVVNALTNCLRVLEDISGPPLHREKIAIELRANESVPSEPLVDFDAGVAKLDSLAGLLAYLANSSAGRDVQAVFFALLTNVESIRDLLSGVADRMMDASPET
jgi:hypothetical protein